MHFDILIIGAGAAGLMSMKELTAAGYKVGLLEASGSAGGRIRTFNGEKYDPPIEKGAEFIHGKAAITLELLKKAGIGYSRVDGKMIRVQDGVWLDEEIQEEQYALLEKKLADLTSDSSINEFLDEHFPVTEYALLRKSVQQFAEGFSLADTSRASVLALRSEWKSQQEEQYRVNGGYAGLIDYLIEQSAPNGTILYNTAATIIEHREGEVTVHTKDGKRYEAAKVIVTVPLAILQSRDINFSPALAAHEAALNQLASGSVIKFLFHFQHAFWNKREEGIGFLLSNETIPTWWTQSPASSCLLAGWLGGPAASKAGNMPKEQMLEMAVSSLANIFGLEKEMIKNMLRDYEIIRWDDQPFIECGYSYNTIGSKKAKEILGQPINNSVYFAGEAIFTGESQGTVEAALGSGKQVVHNIMNS